MREFTEEEKEKIISTPVTTECFDMTGFESLFKGFDTVSLKDFWEHSLFPTLEGLRMEFRSTKDERYFTELVRLLPNSYKVVKL